MTRVACFVLLIASVGCFPIELDLNVKGQMLIPRDEGFFLYEWRTGKVTRLPWQGKDMPVYARFAPNGKEVLLVSRSRKTSERQTHFEIMPLHEGKPRSLLKTDRDVAAAMFSPDGKSLAVQQMRVDGADLVHELNLVDVGTGKAKILSEGAILHRWADSKQLLMTKIEAKLKESRHHVVQFALLDAADATLTVLGKAYGSDKETNAASHDGKKLLFTAFDVQVGDKPLDLKKTQKTLFEFDINNKKLRTINIGLNIDYARYSPDSTKVLLITEPNGEVNTDKRDVVICDADLQDFQTIARNAHRPLVAPGWLDEKTVFYFTKVNVFGTTGHALHMNHIGIDGMGAKNVQPDLDLAVLEIVEKK